MWEWYAFSLAHSNSPFPAYTHAHTHTFTDLRDETNFEDWCWIFKSLILCTFVTGYKVSTVFNNCHNFATHSSCVKRIKSYSVFLCKLIFRYFVGCTRTPSICVVCSIHRRNYLHSVNIDNGEMKRGGWGATSQIPKQTKLIASHVCS